MSGFEIKEIQAKSILSPSRLKDADYDYSCNPYVGCRFGCVYCYASFMARMVGKKTTDWGNFVFAKTNAADLLRVEIKKLPHKGRGKVFWFSSVTDPYQGLEKKYHLTRNCLKVLVENDFKGTVSFLTKSNLVLDDIDVLQRLNRVEVGMTITNTSDEISRYFEKYAPAAPLRLKTLSQLNHAGITTYAFVGPLLPHFIDRKSELKRLFGSIYATGVREIYFEYLNLSPYIRSRMEAELDDMDRLLWKKFYATQNKDYRKQMDKIVYPLIEQSGLTIRLGGTLYHKEMC